MMTSSGKSRITDIFKGIDIYTKRGLEGYTAFVVIVLSSLFFFIFIIPFDVLHGIPNWILYLMTEFVFLLIKLILFSDDKLYYSDPPKNQYAKAFQKYWPSIYMQNKFNLDKQKADYYWFEKIFNKWKNPNHPRHQQWQRTIRRGFRCRFVYYFIRCVEFLIILSSVCLLVYIIIVKNYSNLILQVSYIVFLIILYIVFRSANRTDLDNLRGVWRQYREINELHIQFIDDNFHTIDDLKNYN